MAPLRFLRWDGVAVVSSLRLRCSGGVAPFGCSGAIYDAPTFLRRDGGCGGVFIVLRRSGVRAS